MRVAESEVARVARVAETRVAESRIRAREA